MVFYLIEKVFFENKPLSKLKLVTDVAVDASTRTQTFYEKYPRASKGFQMLDNHTQRRGNEAGARF